jgi:hypothetical protein
MIITAAAGRPRSWRWVRGEILDDLYSDGREVTVESEQADEEEDDNSEIGEEAKNADDFLSSLLVSGCGRVKTGGRGTDTEARRRS